MSDKSGSGLSSFDADEKVSAENILAIFSMPNLLAPKRLVIIKRMIMGGADSEQKKMVEYLKNSKSIWEDTDLVAVFWEDGMPKKNNTLYKLLVAKAKSQELAKLTGLKLSQWIIKRITELDSQASISREALDRLISFVGNDPVFLDSEIRKLVDYADGKMIGADDVDKLVLVSIDSNIFSTIDALGANNKKEALALLHNHLKNGDDPFYIMSMFVYQFRNLLKIAGFYEKGIRSDFEIAKVAKLHPFVVKKSLAQMRNFSLAKLKNVYRKLGEIDAGVKTGKMDINLALDLFVAEL